MLRATALLLIGATVAQAAIPASERAVLQNLYIYTTNRTGWAHASGWNGPPGSECLWYGITCDADGTTVVAIDLSSNSLSGMLPPISALTNLQRFNVGRNGIANNELVGPLPSLAGLTKLQYFRADGVGLTGSIPELSGLTSLVYFNVSFNRLTGSIPSFAGLLNLAYFDARYNALTGELPSFDGLSNLDYFRANENHLTGSIPSLTGLSKLANFDVGGNELTGGIPALTGLTSLQYLQLGTNQLSGPIPPLSGLANLQIFGASLNHLTGEIPPIADLANLSSITLAFNELSGPAPSPPAGLAALGSNLCRNALTPAADPPTTADVAWNAATGTTPWSSKCTQTPAVTRVGSAADDTQNVNASTYGEPVTFRATLYGGIHPTGTMTFSSTRALHDGTLLLCANVPLDAAGRASCTTSILPPQSSNIVKVDYSGDAANAPSSDSYIDQVVEVLVTETASADAPQVNQAVDLVAEVVGGNPGDTVTFYDGIAPLCANVPVTPAGPKFVARCATTFSQTGIHSLSAVDVNGSWALPSVPIIITVAAAQPFDANQFALTGSWFNAFASGQGLTIEVYPDFVAAGKALLGGGWFTYDMSGNQRWLYLQGAMTSAHGSTVDLGVYTSSGGNFNAPPATSAVNYGSATLAFYDCSHATLAYTFLDGRSGTIAYTRLTSPTGCTTAVPATVPLGLPAHYDDVLHSGNWFNPATGGQGLVVDIVPSQNAFVATWYTYAPQSEGQSGVASQRWFSIQSPYTPGNLSLSDLPIYATQGGIFNAPAPVGVSPVGAADITFTSCTTMTLHYTFTQGEFAGLSGTIAEQPVGPVGGCE